MTRFRLDAALLATLLVGCSAGEAPNVTTANARSFSKEYWLLLVRPESPSQLRAAAQESRNATHLYISTRYGGETLIFPLVNGLPATRPSRVIRYIANGATGEAVGPDGTVYVDRYALGTYYLDAYPPENEGGGVRETQLDFYGGPVALDASNNLYIGGVYGRDGRSVVEVYSPPPGRKLIRRFATVSAYSPYGMAIGEQGRLYITDGGNDVAEYDDPLEHPQFVRAFCTKHREYFVAEKDRTVYVGGGVVGRYPHNFAAFGARDTACPAPPERVIGPDDVPNVFAKQLAVSGNLLYGIMSPTDNSNPKLYVFDIGKERQKPLAVLTNPAGFGGYVAVGP